eukprot:TRINITY_DN18057_c0_g1_i1.p1 TRINITY_DN18057_c0_g1~~TRINITY_DN18057_c0_g1_i1.p1  ORF type:complete len:316 (+),score=98.32 TRINITY_DN18057_c0_g1_i1:70-1017(+)
MSAASQRRLGVGLAVLVLLALLVMVMNAGPSGASPTAASNESFWGTALEKSWKTGSAGFLAGMLQVLAFMWLRTVMNHQYANGGSMLGVLAALYAEGGVGRFYKGLEFAIVQAPMTRFGDTFLNNLVTLAFQHHSPGTAMWIVTMLGSTLAAAFRIAMTPIDTFKTTRQVHGDAAYTLLVAKVSQRSFLELFAGWEANFAASWAGNYPWFFVYNTLQGVLVKDAWAGPYRKHIRNAIIGVAASTASDVASNCIRVVKTIRQTHPDPNVGYFEAARRVVRKDGVLGFLGRGLGARLFVNMLQGVFFTVIWRALSEA